MVRENISGVVVSKVIDGTEEKKKPKPGPGAGGKSGKVETWQVDPVVWQAALKLVDGDAMRLVPESETRVRIR